MIIYLHGPDSYRARQRLHFYRDGYKKKYDPSGLNVVRLDGEKLTLEIFRQHAGQMGFLAKKIFIIIENLISKNKSKKIQAELVEYLDQGWNDDNVAVFLEEIPPGRRPKKTTSVLEKRLLKDKSEEFPLLIGEKLNQWIKAEVARRGGRISSPAILELASLVGSDLWNMSAEIDKLVSYRAGEEISGADVQSMVRAKFDGNIFHLTAALAAKDAKLAFRLLYEQLAAGAHELYLLTMLIREFRILLQVSEIIDQESNYHTVATRLQLHPFVAQKAIRDARKFTLPEIKKIYQLLLAIDIKIKSSQTDPRLLFDLLVTKVCGI